MEARPGPLEHVGSDQGNDDGEIRQEPVGQEHLAEPAQLVGEGQGGLDIAAGTAQHDGGDLRVGELDEGPAEEVAKAHAKGGT